MVRGVTASAIHLSAEGEDNKLGPDELVKRQSSTRDGSAHSEPSSPASKKNAPIRYRKLVTYHEVQGREACVNSPLDVVQSCGRSLPGG